ncbi:MAG: hypothetical protein WDN48_03720 [Pseudolabrys sp.]
MTGKDHHHPGHSAHPATATRHALRHRALMRSGRQRFGDLGRGLAWLARHRYWRRFFWSAGLTLAVTTLAVLGLWWRLSSGPIELDVATPWLKLRSRTISAASTPSSSAARRSNATRGAARRCACVTS